MCWQGHNKSIENWDLHIWRRLVLFSDAVGLYTVRLLWSINVNQHVISGREIYALVVAQASEDKLYTSSILHHDATGHYSLWRWQLVARMIPKPDIIGKKFWFKVIFSSGWLPTVKCLYRNSLVLSPPENHPCRNTQSLKALKAQRKITVHNGLGTEINEPEMALHIYCMHACVVYMLVHVWPCVLSCISDKWYT